MKGRTNVVIAVTILALGIGGVALANRAATSTEVDITLKDGKLSVSPTSFTAGKVTLVVTNKGKVAHALAIMGTGLQPKSTPTLKSGKSATLTLTLRSGMYHVWDTLTSSMSRATMLTVKSASASGSSSTSGSGSKSGGSTSGGSTSGGSSSGGSTSGGSTSGGSAGTGGAMDSTDPCAGMM
jgi:hypothetical protein